MKKIILFTLIISIITLGGYVSGQKVCGKMGGWGSGAAPLEKNESSFQTNIEKKCMGICQERVALMEAMRDEKSDEAAIHARIEKIGNLQVLLEKEIASHIFEVKSGLPPAEQRAYLDRIHKELKRSINQCGYGEILKD